MPYLVAYVAAAVVFAGIDASWLTFAGPRVYKPVIGPLLADKVVLAPAVVFYVLYILGIIVIAVAPALKENASWTRAAGIGAMLGLVAYGTYDLTNQATLKLWATKLTLMDMTYGAVATALAATAAFHAAKWAMRTF